MRAGSKNVLALSGGVGGAKLALGLYDTLGEDALDVVVNTGDDFTHLGLHISPDIDTVLYTLGGLSDEERGWGLADETWQAMTHMETLGGDTWFRLGDRDLATHLWRTARLNAGESLTRVTAGLASSLGVKAGILPMSDDPVRTTVHTDIGALPFQHYFVKEQCRPAVTGFDFEGIAAARPNPALMQALEADAYGALVVCPSNPFVSVDPVLRLPGLCEGLKRADMPVVLVSPIVGGVALKGPAAKMMGELSVPVTAEAVAGHYCANYPGLMDYFVIDESDATLASSIEAMGVATIVTKTVMKTRSDKQALAQTLLTQVLG